MNSRSNRPPHQHQGDSLTSEQTSAGVDFSFGFETDSGYTAPALETEKLCARPGRF